MRITATHALAARRLAIGAGALGASALAHRCAVGDMDATRATPVVWAGLLAVLVLALLVARLERVLDRALRAVRAVRRRPGAPPASASASSTSPGARRSPPSPDPTTADGGRMSVKLRAAALAAVAAAGAAGVAAAHDEVEGATPARGAVLRNLPPKVSMTFGEPVGRLDRVTITRNGRGDFLKSAQIDPRHAARVVAVLRRPGGKARKGAWKVTWRVTSADGHRQVLSAGFRVR